MSRRGYSGYHGRATVRDVLKAVLVVLVVVLVLVLAGLMLGQRYIVYTDDGVRLELPFFQREEQPPSPDQSIKSIIAEIGSQAFPRVKIGVGAKPNPDYDLADWVLSSFSASDEKALAVSLKNAADAALAIIDQGVPEAANRFNGSHP